LITTLLIIGITCVVSFAGFNNPRFIEQWILWPPAVQRGQYYRLVTHGFVHADQTHLLFNMFTLFFFGRGWNLSTLRSSVPRVSRCSTSAQ